MALYGVIGTLEYSTATLIFVGVLLVLMLLEFFFRKLEHLATEHGYMDVFEKLKKELMILGIISFITQLVVMDCASSSYLSAFELAHILVLFMAIAFIFQAVFLVRYAMAEGKHFHRAVRTSSEDLLLKYDALESSRRTFSRFLFHRMPSWFPSLTFKSYIEYKIAENFFNNTHQLPSRFQFAKYADNLFKVSSLLYSTMS